jgi:hypothetical protein
MTTNTILVVMIAGFTIVGLLAYESYVQASNNPATQIGQAIGSGLKAAGGLGALF